MIDAIQFSSFAEFLDMGGYAFNVWAVYFLFAIFLTVNLTSPIRKRKQILQDLQRRITMAESSTDDSNTPGDLSESGPVGETQ
jgi:heme exporter protein CcmD